MKERKEPERWGRKGAISEKELSGSRKKPHVCGDKFPHISPLSVARVGSHVYANKQQVC